MKHVLIVFLLFTAGVAHAQTKPAKKPVADAYRNKQWKPAQGKYYFSHALIYEFTNKVQGTNGELWVFIDPVTGTMCFQRESSFGATDDMNESILALPTGQVIACGTTEAGKKIRESFQNRGVKPEPDEVQYQREAFRDLVKPTGNQRQDFGWTSEEYVMSFEKTNEKTKLWLAEVSFNVYPLYAFDEWGDAQLPVSLNYVYVLPQNKLVVESEDQYGSLKLKSYEPNPYYLDLNEYAKQY